MKRRLIIYGWAAFLFASSLSIVHAESFTQQLLTAQTSSCHAPENFSVVVDYDNYDYPAFVLSWDSVESAVFYNIYLDGSIVQIETENTFSVLYGAVGVNYCFAVTAVCGDNLESDFSEVICETISDIDECATTEFVVVALNDAQVNIAWEPVSTAVGYNIYRNDDFLTFVTDNYYVDTVIQYEEMLCYSIQTICQQGLSELSPEECEEVDIEEHASSFSIYPNPTHQYLTVQSKTEMEAIYIFNSIGQIIYRDHHCGTLFTIPVSDWKKGLFIVQIISKDSRTTQKVIIQ